MSKPFGALIALRRVPPQGSQRGEKMIMKMKNIIHIPTIKADMRSLRKIGIGEI